MNSPFMTSRPFLSSAAGRAAFGLLVFAVLGGCTSQSAGVKDTSAGGDMQTLIDQRVAAIQADLKAKFDAQVALLNDSSSTKIETSGGNAVVDKRLASVEALFDARLKAEVAALKLQVAQSTQQQVSGEGATAQDTDQSGFLNIAIPVAGGGLGGIAVLAMWQKHTRKTSEAADKEETARQKQVIDGMNFAFYIGFLAGSQQRPQET